MVKIQEEKEKKRRRKVALNVVLPINGKGTTRFGRRRKPRWNEAQVQLMQSPKKRVTRSFIV